MQYRSFGKFTLLPLLAMGLLLAAPRAHAANAAPDTAAEEGWEDAQRMQTVDIKEVGPISEESAAQNSKNRWYRIGMALGAVAVATVAIVLASSNDGHHTSH